MNGDRESVEAVWAIEHLGEELRNHSGEEPISEVLNFLATRKMKQVRAVVDLGEFEKLWDEYLACTQSGGTKLSHWGNPEGRIEQRKKSWDWRLNPWK